MTPLSAPNAIRQQASSLIPFRKIPFLSVFMLICAVIVFHGYCGAAGMYVMRTGDVEVSFEGPLEKVARQVTVLYPSLRSELEETFRTTADFIPTVIILEDRAVFQRYAGASPVVAVAISSRNLIVIDNTKMKTHPFTLEITLKHELAHLLLRHIVGDGRLPRWLNEGISQWVSDGIAEIIVVEKKDALKQALLSGRLIPLADLTDRFPGDEQSLRLAYEESKSVVAYMIREHGLEAVLGILQALSDGNDVNSAVRRELSLSLEELESRWIDDLRRRYTWVSYVSEHVYELVFSFGALLLLYGFIRFLIRKRRYRDEEEEDESE